MKFKKLRKVLSKTDFIQLCISDKGNENIESFLNIGRIPEKFNNFKVLGVGYINGISIGEETPLKGLQSGIEVVLTKDHK